MALLQLQSKGQEDMYLTSNPEITFFKTNYKRHTNFAIETIEHTFSGDYNFNNNIICTLNKSGDLLSKSFIKLELSAKTNNTTGKWGWIKNIGHHVIDFVSVEIGNNEIDRHYGNWLNIWYELTKNENIEEGYDILNGNTSDLTSLSHGTGLENDKFITLFIPLNFYFCRNYNVAFPLVALTQNQVKFIVKLKESKFLYNKTNHAGYTVTPKVNYISLLTDFIYLDTNERRYFFQSSHEYLIEQVQNYEKQLNKYDNVLSLNFKHLVKSLFWTINPGKYINIAPTTITYFGITLEEITKRFILSYFYLI